MKQENRAMPSLRLNSNDKMEQKMKSIDFHKDKLGFKSNDSVYPDIYIYKHIEKQNFSTTN